MDDKELITHKGVSSTQQISSLVLLCATKTRSHKKRKRICRECVDCFGQGTVLECWTESGLCTRDGHLRADSHMSQFYPTNLFLSLYLWCKDLVLQKKGKGYAGNVLILSYRTVFMHWWESWLCTRDGCLRAEPLKRSQFHPANFFFSLNLWCKDLVPQKRKKISSECVDCFGQWTVFTRSEKRVDFVQEMGG